MIPFKDNAEWSFCEQPPSEHVRVPWFQFDKWNYSFHKLSERLYHWFWCGIIGRARVLQSRNLDESLPQFDQRAKDFIHNIAVRLPNLLRNLICAMIENELWYRISLHCRNEAWIMKNERKYKIFDLLYIEFIAWDR